MTEMAVDAVRVLGLQATPIRRRRSTSHPCGRGMTAQTEIARAIEGLLGNSHGRPEKGITAGMGHHAAAPFVGEFDTLARISVAVVAFFGRLECAHFSRLGSRLLDIGRNDLRRLRDGQHQEYIHEHGRKQQSS